MKKEQSIMYEGIEKIINKALDTKLRNAFNEFELRLDKKVDKRFVEFEKRIDAGFILIEDRINSLRYDFDSFKDESYRRFQYLEQKIAEQGQSFERHVSAVYEKFQQDLAASLEGIPESGEDIATLKDDVSELKHDMKSVKAVLGIKSHIYHD